MSSDPASRPERAPADDIGAALRHELRNRLACIRNAAFYLLRRVEKTPLYESDARVPQFFRLIDEELVTVEQMLSARAGTSALQRSSVSRTRIEDVLEAALAAAHVPASILVERSVSETHRTSASAPELTLLVRSLIDNSIEAMRDGGTLWLRTREHDGYAVLEVTDSGTGRFAEEHARVLDPFSATGMGHVGIGLNFAWRIVERHGGALHIAPSETGSTVRVSLPCPPDIARHEQP